MNILSTKATCERVSVSRTQLWKMVKDKRFPQPVPIDGNRIGYVDAEVDKWIESRIAARDGEAA
ncbi:MAG: AlpA family phage regulatory protein [Pseudomonadota bacterium]